MSYHPIRAFFKKIADFVDDVIVLFLPGHRKIVQDEFSSKIDLIKSNKSNYQQLDKSLV